MHNNSVSILNYGMGNILSVSRAFEYCGASVKVISSASEISSASRLVIPGVGAFPKAMENINHLGLFESIKTWSGMERPLLGICLGMQLMFDSSTEFSVTNGLGIIPGEVMPLPRIQNEVQGLKIPNIGWENVLILDSKFGSKTQINESSSGTAYYFVHSYHAVPKDKSVVKGHANYGDFAFVAIAAIDNLMGVQFHPEKSGKKGILFLEEFLAK